MTNLSRRTFLKSATVAASGTLLIPNLFSCSANNKLNIALIGVGGRGEDNWKHLFSDENGDSEKKQTGPIQKILRENVYLFALQICRKMIAFFLNEINITLLFLTIRY